MSILACYSPRYKEYFVNFLCSHRNLQWVRFRPSLKCIFYISYVLHFGNTNLRQLPLGFQALGLPKLAGFLLKETIL